MIKHKLLSAVSALALMGSVAAQANVTITINGVAAAANNGLTSVYANTAGFVTENFNSTTVNVGARPANYGVIGSNSGQVVTGTTGQYAAPSSNATAATVNTSAYLTVPTGSSSGTLTITTPLQSNYNYFGMYWGSVDTYNSVTFYKGATKVGEVLGQQVIALPNPDLNQGDRNQAVYVNFFLDTAYDSIILTSTSYAFESDNHVFGVVPVPGSAVLMLSGLLGAAFLGRRRKAGQSAA